MQFKKCFLGKKFQDQIVKPKLIEELMTEQKATLKNVQPLADWEKQVREQHKQLRFGINIRVPERPTIHSNNLATVFPCPVNGCRGFVEIGVCGLCKKKVCMMCHELSDGAVHHCKVEDLQSLALLSNDSRNCPKCCAVIFRTAGCDHMFCTNCHTHFNWKTMKILTTSTNGHYLHLQRFSENIPLRDTPLATETTGGGSGGCTQEFSLYRDGVPLESVDQSKFETSLVHCLWTDSNAVRLVKRKKYHEPTITTKYAEQLQSLQIRYLLGEIDENSWKTQVYQKYQEKTLGILYGQVLDIYLATLEVLQRGLLNGVPSDGVMSQYLQLVDLCNQSFDSIREEYGGVSHHIRSPIESINAPSFT